MIDLIIPYYNNRIGLLDTLRSINTDIFKVTIIDDFSTKTPIINNSVAQVFRLNINCGPGNARQRGIDKTSNPYIMFIDTGDMFLSKKIQEYIVQVIQAYPDANVISFPYYYKNKITSETDNRMHGKVYKREFLNKYDITFSPAGSYMNEDIGFNHTCRLCTDAELIPFAYAPKPVLKWIENENSLTQKNNNEVLYKDQTHALSINIFHTIDICRKNNIDPKYEIHQIACSMYYWIIRTIVERPEFAQDAWSGAKIFFDKYKDEIKLNELIGGNAYLKKAWQYKENIKFPINILKFVDEILKYEIIPDKYLT